MHCTFHSTLTKSNLCRLKKLLSYIRPAKSFKCTHIYAFNALQVSLEDNDCISYRRKP